MQRPFLGGIHVEMGPQYGAKKSTWDLNLAIGAPKISLGMVLFWELLLGLVSTLQTTPQKSVFREAKCG